MVVTDSKFLPGKWLLHATMVYHVIYVSYWWNYLIFNISPCKINVCVMAHRLWYDPDKNTQFILSGFSLQFISHDLRHSLVVLQENIRYMAGFTLQCIYTYLGQVECHIPSSATQKAALKTECRGTWNNVKLFFTWSECRILTILTYIVACQRGGVSNKPLGQRQDTGPGMTT